MAREERSNILNMISKASSIWMPVFLMGMFILGLMFTWLKWSDILIDFGRELYVPWQINSGKVLYKDIAHLFGPFSQYANALIFKLFGASYLTIAAANVAILAFFVAVLYSIIKKTCSQLTAFISCSVVILVFSFPQYLTVGNYNFVSPYSHEATHGLVLSLLMIHQLWRFAVNKFKRNLLLAGFIFGLIFLTKIEILFSGSMVVSVYFFLNWLNCKDVKETLKKFGLFFAGFIIPIFIFWLYFLSVMPLKQSLVAVCGSWVGFMGAADIANSKFYLANMGLIKPLGNLVKIIWETMIIMLVIAVIIFLCHSIKKYKKEVIYVGLCVVLLVIIIFAVVFINPHTIGKSLPVLSLAAVIFLFYSYLAIMKKDKGKANAYIPMLLWSVFSFGMLYKMLLSGKVYHYGFFLALPSVVLLVSMLVWYLPEWLNKKFLERSIFRSVMVIIIVICCAIFVQTSRKYYQDKTFSVGTGKNRILAYDPMIDSRGLMFDYTVKWINSHFGENETFVVIPEGAMLNYLTKRINPTPYINFMPPEIRIFNEDVILDNFKKQSPDYFVAIYKNTADYGVNFFGQDIGYGKKITDWVQGSYAPVFLIGMDPFQGTGFGIKILKKKE